MPMKKILLFFLFVMMAFTAQTQWSGTGPQRPLPGFSGSGQTSAEIGWVNFAQFQPAGDGKTDDSPKLIQALAYCRLFKVGLLVDPARTYLLATPIAYAFAGTVAIRSAKERQPAVFYLPDSQLSVLSFSAAAGTLNTKLAKEIRLGDKTITLVSTTGLRVGDLIVVRSTVDWPIETLTKKGEYNVVESVVGQVVTLKHPCQDSYIVSEIQAVTNYLSARLDLQDIELNIRKTGNRSVIGLVVSNTQHSRIERVQIKNAQYASSQFYGCYTTEIAHCVFENANEEGEGYGIATVGGLLYDIHDNRSYGCRKLGDFSSNGTGGPTRYSRALRNEAVGEGTTNRGRDLFTTQSFCIATHGGAESILIQENTAINCNTGFQLRGRGVTLSNNRIRVAHHIHQIRQSGRVVKLVGIVPNAQPHQRRFNIVPEDQHRVSLSLAEPVKFKMIMLDKTPLPDVRRVDAVVSDKIERVVFNDQVPLRQQRTG